MARGWAHSRQFKLVGQPYDHTEAASVLETLEHEEVYLNDYRPSPRQRPTSTASPRRVQRQALPCVLGYVPPTELEAVYALAMLASRSLWTWFAPWSAVQRPNQSMLVEDQPCRM